LEIQAYMFPEQVILIGSLLLLISIILSKTSHRLGIPFVNLLSLDRDAGRF